MQSNIPSPLTSKNTRYQIMNSRMQKLMSVAICLLAEFICAPPAFTQDIPPLESKLISRMQEMDCPGALVGVFADDSEPVLMALGVSDINSQSPMTLDMHMYIGSVMKPFLGTVVLLLAEEEELSLDDPVSKYVDQIPLGDKITLRMLGNNTSGLFNTIENKEFQKAIMASPERVWKPEEILEYTFVKQSYHSPGEKWRYSNTNSVILGLCIEKVTGKPFVHAIKERILEPLGLRHTGVVATHGLPVPHSSAYRHGYEDKVIGYGDVFYDVSNYSPSWTGAAGSMYATLEDLGRAVKPLATGQLLKPSTRKELHRWVEVGHENYLYGFTLGKKGEGIGHPGDVPGYNAFFTYYPKTNVSVVVLTNLSNNKDGTMPAEELAKVVIGERGIE